MNRSRGKLLLVIAAAIVVIGVNQAAAMTAPLPMQAGGSWSPSVRYPDGSVVTYEGRSWILIGTATVEPPAVGDSWEPLDDDGLPGPLGPAGTLGLSGQAGAAGVAGPVVSSSSVGAAGSGGPTGSGQSSKPAVSPADEIRFPTSGRVTVPVPGLRGGALVLLQYVSGDPGRLLPAAVQSTGPGHFVARGTPGARFRYVVLSAG